MRAAGCTVTWFRRLQWFDWMKYNHRSHRHLLVVDGRIGFTGGVGIADEWTGHAQSPAHWRDTHVRLARPIVAALQSGFTDNWNQSTEELLLDARDFPDLPPAGDVPVCAVLSTPASGASAAQRVMAALIAGATRSLSISSAYLIPTASFIDALCAARGRGVDVRSSCPAPSMTRSWSSGRAGTPGHASSRTGSASTVPADDDARQDPRRRRQARAGGLDQLRSAVVLAERGVRRAGRQRPVAADTERAFEADLEHAVQVLPAALAARGIAQRAADALCIGRARSSETRRTDERRNDRPPPPLLPARPRPGGRAGGGALAVGRGAARAGTKDSSSSATSSPPISP